MLNFPKYITISWRLLLILIVCHQQCTGLRILGLFPFQGKSHFIMSERLMISLAEKGHHVDVYSHFPRKNPPPNYKDFSLAGILPDLMNNLTYDYMMYISKEQMGSMKTILDLAGKPICKLMSLPVFQELLHNPPKDPPYDIIVGEACLSLCYLAWGRYLNVPMIDISSNILYDWSYKSRGDPLTPAVLPILEHYYKSPDTLLNRVQNVLLYNVIDMLFWYHVREQDQLVNEYFGPGYPNVYEMQKDIALMFVNYHPSLHGVRPSSPSVISISGIHISDKNETISQDLEKWLNASADGFVYFSFGSMMRIETLPVNILKAFYKAFEKIAPTRVLWKVVNPKDLPPNLPKNVMLQNWLPQQKILKHKNIKAFVTHGGLMGTLESIYFGVPMLGVPLFAEQFANVNMYAKKKIAVRVDLDNVESDFERGLVEVLKNPDYKKSAAIVSAKYKDSLTSPLDTAIYWVEYVARHGKDALRSPIVDMPWWQTSLLDVYAFLSALLVLSLYASVKLIRLIARFFLARKHVSLKVKKN